jgi:metal-responsive CopG/Arc/MetJ family transcriptional regulator
MPRCRTKVREGFAGVRAVRTVTVRLNQQQLELLDRTASRLGVDTRAELLKHALREYAREEERSAGAEVRDARRGFRW